MSKSKRHFYESVECLKPVVPLRCSNILLVFAFLGVYEIRHAMEGDAGVHATDSPYPEYHDSVPVV